MNKNDAQSEKKGEKKKKKKVGGTGNHNCKKGLKKK